MKYLMLIVIASLLIAGCIMWPIMALIVSVFAVLCYTFIVGVFVYPSLKGLDADLKKERDGNKG
jgi:hypothetical protein